MNSNDEIKRRSNAVKGKINNDNIEAVSRSCSVKVETIRSYLNKNTDIMPENFVHNAELHFSGNKGKIAENRFGSYGIEQTEAFVGQYQLIRPSFNVKDSVVKAKVIINWDHTINVLQYTQEKLETKFKWKVGGVISSFNNSGVYHFIETDNRFGRQHIMSVKYRSLTGGFFGQETAITRSGAIISLPVIMDVWKDGMKTGTIYSDNKEYVLLFERLSATSIFCEKSHTLRSSNFEDND